MTHLRHFCALDRVLVDPGGAIASRGSAALLGVKRSAIERAAVFIHGFGASPVSSWSGYTQALEVDPAFDDIDGYFFGYKSKSSQLGTLASKCAAFLSTLASGKLHPLLLADKGVVNTAPNSYEAIIVAAHSMGAVVLREALLLLATQAPPLQTGLSLRLFAPAHAGARVPAALLGAAGASPLIQSALSAATAFIPAGVDLDREKSPYLANLRVRTEQYVKDGLRHLSAACAFGDEELVVVVDQFACDTRQVPDPSPHNHFSIVKITPQWNWPVRFVTQ